MLKLSIVAAAATMSAGLLAAPVSATVTSPLPILTPNSMPQIEQAAFNGRPHGFHRRWWGHGRGGWGWRHRGWGWRHHGWGWGGVAIGFGIGAYGAGYPYGYYGGGYASGHVQYCLNRYRSYDPRSNTFMGYDGMRHLCR
jgi:hypothetical protein